ncbi:MAG: PAS domain S-box protein [Hydrogenophaga sp.]|jgi:PAS domain S-box-containing protein|uniref:sensor histidine kinase n=1 Tax=Hydrogenophaga sp. TaxID=1904254 RepID=UPI001D2FD7E1|nr:PAS domain-containing sensor histidine kinase [Hydrogenophaga sp.]MBW0171110.1 PAS domain-containing sensor histidine kinase [Hydrogenophaga sp.]MBW0184543.1 PAS domain-containing sensor histidine kinase [Hydrogenophaga sp.]
MHLDASTHLVSRPQTPSAGAWRDPLALLLASTGEGVFGVDLDGLCVFINHAGARMIGFEPAELLGCNMHDLTHHSHADGAHYPVEDCPIFNAFRQGLPCRIDSEVFWRRDGSAFPVEYSSHPILDGGEVRGAVVTFVDITERKRAADALQRAKDELEERVGERTLALATALKQVRELAARSETVREDERTRIAREVHDELGSLLVALKMDVNWMDKRLAEQEQRTAEAAHDMRERMRCKCQNMSRLIETAVDNVGRIITDLRPSILDHQGLWAALEWQAQEFVQSAEMALDWCMEVADAPEPPEPLAMAVFRIFQEMLSNVGRHARANRLGVHIVVQGTALQLTVQDNGVGAPPQAFEAANAYGVMGMRERARHFGGHIQIDSAPGQGTRMCLAVALRGDLA